jgi:SAM-dependent methyltransferase
MNRVEIERRVDAYYSGRVQEHGATPRGADWNSAESQRLRFDQLLRLCAGARERFTLVDLGCGYGALLGYLVEHRIACDYIGVDLSEEMIHAARAAFGEGPTHRFLCAGAAVPRADYVLASGIFNVKLDLPEEDWREYLLETLDSMAALAHHGFGFNALSTYSEPERRRPDLYYADPLELFHRCKTRLSSRVTLLHDYPLWEFTILVRF